MCRSMYLYYSHCNSYSHLYFDKWITLPGKCKTHPSLSEPLPPSFPPPPPHPASVFSPWLDNVQSIIHCYVIYVLVHESNRNCILQHTFYIFIFCVTVYIFGKALFIESERSLHITLFDLNFVFIVLFYLIQPTLL